MNQQEILALAQEIFAQLCCSSDLGDSSTIDRRAREAIGCAEVFFKVWDSDDIQCTLGFRKRRLPKPEPKNIAPHILDTMNLREPQPE
jgi:hypothetical protein